MRAIFPIIALLCGAIAANAQPTDGIDWSLKVEQSVARAQQTGHPLMFWVLGRSSSRDNDIENAQRRAFRDPHVVLLSRYFVAARMSRSRYPRLPRRLGSASAHQFADHLRHPQGRVD